MWTMLHEGYAMETDEPDWLTYVAFAVLALAIVVLVGLGVWKAVELLGK